jgi:hypothetical protein
MQIVNDVQAMMMHQDEKIKIYQNWIIMTDVVRNGINESRCPSPFSGVLNSPKH